MVCAIAAMCLAVQHIKMVWVCIEDFFKYMCIELSLIGQPSMIYFYQCSGCQFKYSNMYFQRSLWVNEIPEFGEA